MTDQTMFLSDLDVYNALNAAVEERGKDFQYYVEFGHDAPCRNFINNQPACIAGNVYARNGVSAQEEDYPWSRNTVGSLEGEGHLSFESYEGYRALETAQDIQDQGYTWGEARTHAFDISGLDKKIAAQQEAFK